MHNNSGNHGAKESDEEKGEKEKSLEQYMEYVPDKHEQEERLVNMLSEQDKQVNICVRKLRLGLCV